MSDAVLVAARLGLYLDLALLFGLPLFALAVLRRASGEAESGPIGRLVVGLALAGLLLSVLHFLLLTAAMSGTGLADLEPALLSTLLLDSDIGHALIVRLAGLLFAAGAGMIASTGRWSGLAAAIPAGGAALATLAWAGHAAATEGLAGRMHLAVDVVHLLAAGTWLSALFALLHMVVRARNAEQLRSTQRALEGFSAVGIAAVAALLLSGTISAGLLLGLPAPAALAGEPYGRLLIAKLGLFLVMLMLAALNRSRLTPQLERALAMGEARRARAALRASLALETGAAVAILAIVSRLGMLAPIAS